jgi:hypothetical protein
MEENKLAKFEGKVLQKIGNQIAITNKLLEIYCYKGITVTSSGAPLTIQSII